MDFDENGYSDCRECRGQRVIPIKHLPTIAKVCPSCEGRGSFDWVEHAMGRPAEYSRNIHYEVSYQNIQNLMMMLQDEARKVHMRAVITIEQAPQYVDYPSLIVPYNRV